MYTLDFMTLPGWIALISGFLVVGQLILTLIFGGIDLDLDMDADGSADFDASSIVSPKGLIHFLFGASWYLVLIQPIRYERTWLWSDWVIAILVGLAVTTIVILIYYWMSKLACEKPKESGQQLVGRTGYIYLNNGNGNYDLNVVVSGSLTTIQVTSINGDDSLKVGFGVPIIDYKDGIYYI